MSIAGKYEHVKNENLKEFILGLDGPADQAAKADAAKTTLDVSKDGDKVTIKAIHPSKETVISFTPGQEFDDPMPTGEILKSTASISGNVISLKIKKDGAEVGQRTYEFSDAGVVITMKATRTPVVAKRHFKRA